jgi:hypothetical protein
VTVYVNDWIMSRKIIFCGGSSHIRLILEKYKDEWRTIRSSREGIVGVDRGGWPWMSGVSGS